MPTQGKSSTGAAVVVADPGFLRACREEAELSREALLAVAVARGCWHYAPLWSDLTPEDRAGLPHEILGCALLRGPADAETFQSIRCGAMVLSDLDNSPERIASAAGELGVTGRVAYIARLGLVNDLHPAFWQSLLSALPSTESTEQEFLPGLSRLVSETRISGAGRGPVRVWLRAAYR